MNAEQQQAYEWAKNQNYQSVAARYAKTLAGAVDDLQAQLTASQQETRAAVEDMKILALAMRESEELSEGCCFACTYDAQNLPDNVILAYRECPGYDTDECFEWRGKDVGDQ